MKRQLLMTAAAIALLAGMNAASAQMGGGQQPGAQNAPSGEGGSRGEEKVKPGVHQKEPGAAVQNQQKEKGSVAQSDQRGGSQDKKMGQQGESKEKSESKEKAAQQGQSKEKVGETKEQTKEKTTQSKDQSKEKMGQQSPTGTQQQQGAQQQQGTQQGAQQSTSSAKSVQLSSTQRTKIQATIKSQSVEHLSRSRVNFDIRVGVRVPSTIHVFVLPAEIVEIVPQFRGFKYIIVEDEILILDPVTLEIVAIIPV